jgi:hypothetical protein
MFAKYANFASIVGLAITVGLLYKESNNPYWSSAALIAASCFMFLGLYSFRKDRIRERAEREEIIRTKDEEKTQVIGSAIQAIYASFGLTGYWLHKVSHDLRDSTTKLLFLNGAGQLNLVGLSSQAELTGRNLCNYVAEILTYFVQKPVAVSIKILDIDTKGREVAMTLARSQNSASGRKIGDSHPIDTGNTAFHKIKSGELSFFFETDLIAAHAEGRYNNTNPLWPQQYKATIVVPIRRGPFPITGDDYSLLGFLCADINETDILNPNMKEPLANMLMVVGDALFVYLDIIREFAATFRNKAQI